ncbi:MAG: cbb3-type cytochrome oxidase assembly protein CcoS [Thiomicrospira sp.]|uniref:cbb3-type cytochrome oxidase assembly protein CcoS n=1 Tax=Thiomicrospira sp. TaxID=935 RepID=UPI0019E39562|nr:cbb3-type cytochrome oxidase assembly protein CcoS [Thiomicrospira sp.]MBE0493063.1 cbb3-type cytochrome oxidase assembly protein CcoS [Thiomicrospira sp.]
MEIIFITIPLVLIVGGLVVAMFIWMAKKGQFDDLDGAAHRILLDDEDQGSELEAINQDKDNKLGAKESNQAGKNNAC